MSPPATYAERIAVALVQLLAVVGFFSTLIFVLAAFWPERMPL